MEHAQISLLAVVAGFTIGHVLFISGYLWVKYDSFSGRCLSLLLACLSIRVSKSVLLLLFPAFIYGDVVISLGVIAMSAVGPLIWLYARSKLNDGAATFRRADILHFVPGGVLSLFAFVLNDNQMFQVYQATVYQIMAYILYSGWIIYKSRQFLATKVWLKEFIGAAAVMAIVFAIQLYTRNAALYITVSAASAVILYLFTLRASLSKQAISIGRQRSRRSADPGLYEKISVAIAEKRLYLDPSLTLNKLSNEVNVPVRIVSAVINDSRQISFSDYINEFRIRDAEEKLSSEKWAPFTIEAIAYDCGFNSLSAFYSSFKKIKNISPARYRKQNSS
jgi:AraC-like DNA-binding protein